MRLALGRHKSEAGCQYIRPHPLLEGFLSFKAQQWALEQTEVKSPDKFVLFMLAYRDNPDEPHGCFPSLSRIAKDCGLSRSTVQSSIKRLLGSGKLRMEHRHGTRGHASSNYYTLPEVYRDAVHPTPRVGRKAVQGIPGRGTRVYRQAVTNSKDLTEREPSRSALPALPPEEQKQFQNNFLATMRKIMGDKSL
jgi:hypothetical protein